MGQKNKIIIFLTVVWILIAAVVIGYPLIKGQIKVGINVVSRDVEPKRFWRAYIASTTLFLLFSFAIALFVRGILHSLAK